MRKKLYALLKKEAFIKKRIRLSSGKISSYYLDVRKVSLNSAGLYYISQLIWVKIKDDQITAFGGPSLGADPIVGGVCFLAHKNKKKLKGFLIRKAPKKYGKQKLIEGPVLSCRDRVMIVDDVATSGASLIKSIEVLRKQKIKVIAALAVVDRQEGAKENLARLNCPLISLFTKSDFL